MDILLIDSINFNDTNKIPQMGLESLYTILSRKFEVKIIDFDLLHHKKEFVYSNDMDEDIERMVDYLIEIYPKVYSFYTISNSYPITVLVAQKISQKKKDAKIVFGGPQATMTVDETMTFFPFVKAIGMGEGELYIEQMMRTIIEDGDLSKVEGVAYRKGNKIVKNTMPRLLTSEELNDISFLDFELKSDYEDEGKVVSIEAGRGCPCGCSFCSTTLFWHKNFRLRDINVIVKEIERLHKEYGVKHVDLQHDHFTVNKKLLDEFCKKLIELDLEVTWGCSSRIDNLKLESIDLMKKSKCRSIFVGFETGSKKMQKELHKNLKIDDAIEKIIYIYNLGIEITVSFIYGLPNETIEDFLETVNVMDRLYQAGVKKIQLHRYMPLPMTEELFKVKNKLYLDKTDIDISIYNDSICSNEIYSMIEKYTDCFTQFYTFDSEVRKKYKHFDFFINFFSSIAKNSPYTMQELVKMYGLEKIYKEWEKDIENAYILMNSGNIEEFFTYDHMPEIFKNLYKKIIDESMKMGNDYYKNIAKYESLVLIMDFNEDVVYEFDYDVLGITNGKHNFEKTETYITFKESEDNQIKITKIKLPN